MPEGHKHDRCRPEAASAAAAASTTAWWVKRPRDPTPPTLMRSAAGALGRKERSDRPGRPESATMREMSGEREECRRRSSHDAKRV